MALGASRSTQAAELAARITGEELRAMGVFADYAPVADVNVNPRNPVIGVRSFSSVPGLVSQMVAAQVRGYQAAGVAATAKHFPGHGDTAVDSHVGLPVIGHGRATLESVDLLPFVAAIDAGVDAVMTGHLLVPAIDDSGLPATLSAPIVTGLLRGRLGFDGVVVTDSLRMEGVRTRFGDGEIAVRALLAGADQLLDPPDLPEAYDAVLDAVASGRISQQRLDDSVRRILRMKADRGLTSALNAIVDVTKVPLIVGSGRHQRDAQSIADQTTTLLTNRGQVPIPGLADSRILVTGHGQAATAALAAALDERGARATVMETGLEPDSRRIAKARSAAGAADAVVVLTYDAGRKQLALVSALQASGTPVIVVSTGAPYDTGRLPPGVSVLATYSDRRIAMIALARVLAGEIAPVGRLPVAIPATGSGIRYPIGWPKAAGRDAG
jgi:beta-N-acetylhexosaminidase